MIKILSIKIVANSKKNKCKWNVVIDHLPRFLHHLPVYYQIDCRIIEYSVFLMVINNIIRDMVFRSVLERNSGEFY